MTYSFHPEAEEELNHAVTYYEESRPHLGMEFAEEVFQTIHRIMDFPNAWQIMHEDIRRCLTKRFPLGLFIIKRMNRLLFWLLCS